MNQANANLNIPAEFVENWQELVDILAQMINVPAALIMRFNAPDIEVYVASQSEENPYQPGDKETLFNSGLYCETVIRSQEKLLVPNALKDEEWKNNPDVKLNMISYLGFPILMPDKNPFGTLCILDKKTNTYSDTVETLMQKFRSLIESHLELIYMNQVLGDQNRKLADYLKEIQALRGVVPICAKCKSIRDTQNEWHSIEKILGTNPDAQLTHTLCPVCVKELYPEIADGENT